MSVAQFLFGLEGLSVYFVSIMALLFFFGAGYAILTVNKFTKQIGVLKSQYAEKNNKYATRLTPTEFFQLHLDEGHASHLLSAIPGFLVSIGILGTFIGLGIAVGEASGAMSSNLDTVESMTEMQNALNGLLTAISFKFQASAWGILSSLIFSATVQVWFGSKLEDLIEEASRDVMEYYKTPAAAIASELAGMEDAMVKALSNLGPQLGTVLKDAITVLEANISQPMKEMNAQIVKLDDSLLVVSTSAKQMKTSAEGLGNMSEKVDESLQNVSRTIGQQLEQANLQTKHSLENMEKSLLKATTKQIETADKQLVAMQGSLTEMTQSIQESSKGQVRAATKMSEDVNATIKHMQSEINRLLEISNQIQLKSEQRMQQIDQTMNRMNASIEQVNNTIGESAEVNNKMAGVFEEMSGVLGGMQLNQHVSAPSFEQMANMNTPSMNVNSEKTMDDWSATVEPDDFI